jgi:hypothetical protein
MDDNAVICPKCGMNNSTDDAQAEDKESVIFDECAKAITSAGEASPHIEETRDEGKDSEPAVSMESQSIKDEEIVDEEIEEPEKKKFRWKSLLIGLFIAVFMLGAAAFSMYYAYNYNMGSSTANYTEAIKKLYGDISKVNSDMAAVISSKEELPADEILAKLPSVYDSLNKIHSAYDKISAPSTYAGAHELLGEAINNNKLAYQQMETILKTPVDPDIQKNIDLLSKYIDDCMSNYTSVKIKNIIFSLPENIIPLPDKLTTWAAQKKSEYSKIMVLIESFSKYFNEMSGLMVAFDTPRSLDIGTALSSARQDPESWDDLMSMIDDSQEGIRTINSNYTKLSVPSQLKNFNKGFGAILSDSLSYLDNLKAAAQAERDFLAIKDTLSVEDQTQKNNEITRLYQEAEKFNTLVKTNYQRFTVDLESEKGKYLNPEYVMTLKPGK